ncbi:MAG: hypothetical protein HY905_08745 [Deltaproteobacteria bacterium]|nr:hypothetical protein [Deltaproteobacteria bacterium]
MSTQSEASSHPASPGASSARALGPSRSPGFAGADGRSLPGIASATHSASRQTARHDGNISGMSGHGEHAGAVSPISAAPGFNRTGGFLAHAAFASAHCSAVAAKGSLPGHVPHSEQSIAPSTQSSSRSHPVDTAGSTTAGSTTPVGEGPLQPNTRTTIARLRIGTILRAGPTPDPPTIAGHHGARPLPHSAGSAPASA